MKPKSRNSRNKSEKWPGVCRSGKNQSPVALSKRFSYKQDIKPIKLDNFGSFKNLCVRNNGHTVLITLPDVCACSKPKLSGGGLTKNYTFDNLHFHWPSEHTIDGIGYDLEAHFVFYADQYGSFMEAEKHPLGLVVMSVLFLETNYTRTNNFRILAESIEPVSEKVGGVNKIKEPINFYEFLPYDQNQFFTYEGSLTTPSCVENVNWLVYLNTANVSYVDLKNLTKIYNHECQPILNNNRSLQNLHSRRVYLRQTY